MRKRNKLITVHLNDEENAALIKGAEKANLTKSEFVRRKAANVKINTVPPLDYKTLCTKAERINDSLEKTLHFISSTKSIPEQVIEDQLDEVRSFIDEIKKELNNKERKNNE